MASPAAAAPGRWKEAAPVALVESSETRLAAELMAEPAAPAEVREADDPVALD